MSRYEKPVWMMIYEVIDGLPEVFTPVDFIRRVKEKIDAQHYEGKKEYWELIWRSEQKNLCGTKIHLRRCRNSAG